MTKVVQLSPQLFLGSLSLDADTTKRLMVKHPHDATAKRVLATSADMLVRLLVGTHARSRHKMGIGDNKRSRAKKVILLVPQHLPPEPWNDFLFCGRRLLLLSFRCVETAAGTMVVEFRGSGWE
jgi:hypothetical protein